MQKNELLVSKVPYMICNVKYTSDKTYKKSRFIKRCLNCKNWRKNLKVFATCAQIKIVSKKSKRIRFSVKKKRKIKFTKIRKA